MLRALVIFVCLSTQLFSYTKDLQKFREIKGFILDMDGVLRRGETAITGAPELINWIENQKMPAIILTNEDRYTDQQLRSDLKKMKINIPDSWEIYTAADAARDFFLYKMKIQRPSYVLVIGGLGLIEALNEIKNPYIKVTNSIPTHFSSEDEDLYVVLGTVDRIQTADLEKAYTWIKKGAKTIITNPDIYDPASKGDTLVGVPSHLLFMLSKAAPTTPYNTGKPNPLMVFNAIKLLQKKDPSLENSEILFIGDTMETDIRSAFEFNLSSALVLTGSTKLEMLRGRIEQPDYVFPSVKELLYTINYAKSNHYHDLRQSVSENESK